MDRLIRASGTIHAGVIWRKLQSRILEGYPRGIIIQILNSKLLVVGTSPLMNGVIRLSQATVGLCGFATRLGSIRFT